LSSTDTGKYLFPANQEDSINFWRSEKFIVLNNYIVGGRSRSGCGLLIDDRSNYGQLLKNILSDTGQCGIGVADGVGHVIDGNKILNLTPILGAGNVAIYVWKQYNSNLFGCGGPIVGRQIQVLNNVADALKPDGVTHSSWWNGGGCDPIAMRNNTWDQAAYNLLYPMAAKNPPPLIPPQPHSCVITSPYSTQTSHRACGANAASSKKR
jgi:hypothetical protein